MVETDEALKEVQRKVLEAITAGIKALCAHPLDSNNKTKLIKLIEDLSAAFDKSMKG